MHLKFWRKHTKSIFMYASVCLHFCFNVDPNRFASWWSLQVNELPIPGWKARDFAKVQLPGTADHVSTSNRTLKLNVSTNTSLSHVWRILTGIRDYYPRWFCTTDLCDGEHSRQKQEASVSAIHPVTCSLSAQSLNFYNGTLCSVRLSFGVV